MTLDRPMPETYWVAPGRLLAGPYPGSRNDSVAQERIPRFLAAGIKIFLDLTEEGEMPPYTFWQDEMVEHSRMSIPDFSIPTPERMAQILDVIDRAIGTRRPVYIHCLGGLGRTGTVVGCYMVRHGMSGTDALKTIRLLRKGTPYADSHSPETDAQRQMVLGWKNGA